MEITADVLQQCDPQRVDTPLVDSILDVSKQKGTGKWTTIAALNQGVPANAIAESVFARCLSALKEERIIASTQLNGPQGLKKIPAKKIDELVEAIRCALYCSKICAYAQGFQLMHDASRQYKWKLDLGRIAAIFRGGCIIRARFLQKIVGAYEQNPKWENLMLAPFFKRQLHTYQNGWRQVVALSAEYGIACPAFMAALSYFDGYRQLTSSANLLQAQRDYFGSHTYERVDNPRGSKFHLNWSDLNRTEVSL